MTLPIRDPHDDFDNAEAIRRLEEEGIVSRPCERRPFLEEVLQELDEMWRTSPPKPGGLARFLESRE
jgi:hypothetical protein